MEVASARKSFTRAPPGRCLQADVLMLLHRLSCNPTRRRCLRVCFCFHKAVQSIPSLDNLRARVCCAAAAMLCGLLGSKSLHLNKTDAREGSEEVTLVASWWLKILSWCSGAGSRIPRSTFVYKNSRKVVLPGFASLSLSQHCGALVLSSRPLRVSCCGFAPTWFGRGCSVPRLFVSPACGERLFSTHSKLHVVYVCRSYLSGYWIDRRLWQCCMILGVLFVWLTCDNGVVLQVAGHRAFALRLITSILENAVVGFKGRRQHRFWIKVRGH